MVRNVRAVVTALMALGAWTLGSASPTEAATMTGCPTTQADLTALITGAGAGGTVLFNCSVATTIPITSTMFIDQSVMLDGVNSQPVTFDGQNATQLFQVGTLGGPVTFTINGLTLARGHSSGRGGVMRNFGTVQILNSLLVGNTAVNAAATSA